jgi:protein TonB
MEQVYDANRLAVRLWCRFHGIASPSSATLSILAARSTHGGLMKSILTKALLGASLAAIPMVATARHPGATAAAPITVNAGDLSFQQWNGRVAQSLDEHLSYPVPIGRVDLLEGAVRVSFHCSDSGMPAGASIVQSSRSSVLDRAALYAVQHISTLHPLPEGIGHDRSMEAWVFFGSDETAIRRMKKGFEQQATKMALRRQSSSDQTASLPPLIIASR